MQFRHDGRRPDRPHKGSPPVTETSAGASVLAERVPNNVQGPNDPVRKLRGTDGTHRSLQHDQHRGGREIIARIGRSDRPGTPEGPKMRSDEPPGVPRAARGRKTGHGRAREGVVVCFSQVEEHTRLFWWERRREFGVVARECRGPQAQGTA